MSPLPPPTDPLFLTAVAAIFLLAGFVKGVIGLGLPTISVGLLGLVVPPVQAAAILVVPSLLTNIQQVRPLGRLPPLASRLWPFLAGILAGTGLGAVSVAGMDPRLAGAALGLALVVYAGLGLASVRFTLAPEREGPAGALAGALTGLVTAATGVFVLPAVPYLQAIGLDKDDLVQALGLSFLVSTVALAALLGGTGHLGPGLLPAAGTALVAALGGQEGGRRLRSRLSPAAFRRWFLTSLLALGVLLTARWLA